MRYDAAEWRCYLNWAKRFWHRILKWIQNYGTFKVGWWGAALNGPIREALADMRKQQWAIVSEMDSPKVYYLSSRFTSNDVEWHRIFILSIRRIVNLNLTRNNYVHMSNTSCVNHIFSFVISHSYTLLCAFGSLECLGLALQWIHLMETMASRMNEKKELINFFEYK